MKREEEILSNENSSGKWNICRKKFPSPSFPEKTATSSAGIGKIFFIMFILFFAVCFHALFFLLFRPLTQEKIPVASHGKGFILLLTDQKVHEAEKEYGLTYFLTYSDPVKADMLQKNHSFGAWENLSVNAGFAPEQLRKEFEKLPPAAKRNKVKDLHKPLPERAFTLLMPPIRSSRFSFSDPYRKKEFEQTPVALSEKTFPVWKFNTGESLHGLPVKSFQGERLLQREGKKVTSYTQYRILFSGKELPPTLLLLRSCGVKELDRLAQRQLYTLLGKPSTFKAGTQKNQPFYYCTIFWSDSLLFPKNTQLERKTK